MQNEQIVIHINLEQDVAYQYSIEHNDVRNMQLVLRAYQEKHDYKTAERQIRVAKKLQS